MTRHRTILAALAIALVAVASACGGEEGPELVSAADGGPPVEATAEPTATAEPVTEAAEATPEPTPTPEPPPVPAVAELTAADFTEVYGCGFGFWASNIDQTAGIFVEFNDFEAANAGQVPPVGAVPSVIWSGRVHVGTDLFANWCDDVVEPGEPESVVAESWQIVDAGIAIEGAPPVQTVGALTATLTGVTLESPAGEQFVLGDLTLTNDSWGAFAG
jgi:hypothetical protein